MSPRPCAILIDIFDLVFVGIRRLRWPACTQQIIGMLSTITATFCCVQKLAARTNLLRRSQPCSTSTQPTQSVRHCESLYDAIIPQICKPNNSLRITLNIHSHEKSCVLFTPSEVKLPRASWALLVQDHICIPEYPKHRSAARSPSIHRPF